MNGQATLFPAEELRPLDTPLLDAASARPPAPTGKPRPGQWPGRVKAVGDFEQFVRDRKWPYVAVDEPKKAIFANVDFAPFDFLVYSEVGPNLLVMVRGRRQMRRAHYEAMAEWQKMFGEDFQGVFVWRDQSGQWQATLTHEREDTRPVGHYL